MGKLGPLTCQHRHTIDDHPRCFIKEGKYILPKQLVLGDKPLQWYHKENAKIGFLDIETSDLKADAGWMVTWALKERGKKEVVVDAITHKDVMNRTFDKELLARLLEEMKQYDVIVTYFGSVFDLPFILTRGKYWKLPYFHREELHQIDMFFQLRGKLATSRKSLKVITQFFDIAGKTNLDFKYWKLASIGLEPELSELKEHNRQDILILEKLFDEFEDYCKFTKRSII